MAPRVDGLVEADGREGKLAEVAVAALEVLEALGRDATGAGGPLEQFCALGVVPSLENLPEPSYDGVEGTWCGKR